MRMLDGDFVWKHLTYERCIPLMREAMTAFSSGETLQHLRSILDLGDGRLFGIMPGAMGSRAVFGAKLVSVFPDNFAKGISSHQGVVILFEPDAGAPVCVVDASSVTAIRTAAASAAATDALARPEASRLALLGYGEQAHTHAHAISHVRELTSIRIWGRAAERAQGFADRLQGELKCDAAASPSVEEAVRDADIICTVTAAKEPVLEGKWVSPGAHVNVVGSSHAGPVEVDNELVRISRFIADSKESVAAQGAEFLRARKAGLVDDSHIVAEIGEVFAGKAEGRRTAEEITVYKSLGHVVQDLASAWMLYQTASELEDG